ncbi:uncharacterized protein LOC111412042 [Olea europaea var. sylvestris]|uniref:Uncharacterized protein LOC111412042 n=1 Tax=Olea europaea subsp. europaea TaxID=158383 RepID=A0A8S0UCG6_OLEEU|nr:uncharacterized protein LOC111412042 [Olea europaea var. sylvestris]CAA3016254.1 uncharacterized protein LOC111412042 [Olea europaea subsp. europaea]
MVGGRELGFPKMNAGSLKEQLVRTTLRNVRSKGHVYVELREDGKKLIFFCTLCLAPCYSDSILFNHLKGNLHSERLAAAKATLLKPNPWPFNDGVFFFHDDSSDQDKSLPVSTSERFKLLDTHHVDENNLVSCCDHLGPNDISQVVEDVMGCDDSSHDQHLNGNGSDLVIPGVLQKEEVSDLVVRQMGVGRIAARICEKDVVSNEIRRIWCEWLVNKDSAKEDTYLVPEHDFAVVAFAYNYNLGRKALLGDIRYLLPSRLNSEGEYSGSSRSKKRKSFSDPEDISEALSNQNDYYGEESQSLDNPNSKLLLAGNDDQLVQSTIIVSKSIRKALRRQHTIASERLCDICQQKMLPSKDVAALLNRKTGRLVCSSRNLTGAFHVFHISCLIHWILLCENEIYVNQSVAPKAKGKSRRRVRAKDGEMGKKDEAKATSKQIYSVFCPECQGTGLYINGEEREKPTVPLSEMFKYKIKLNDAHKAWMKYPEVLQNCSMGLHFPPQYEDMCQENVVSLKLLRFYRAND